MRLWSPKNALEITKEILLRMLHVASITIAKETELLCNYMSIPSLAVKSKMLIMLHFDLSVACLCILMLVCTMGLEPAPSHFKP